MKKTPLITYLAAFLIVFNGCAKHEEKYEKQLLFHNLGTTEQDFRIPSIVKANDGRLLAFADRRYSLDGSDIGWGEIDIQCRISDDNGITWNGNDSTPATVIDGIGGEGFECAHGDAATVCDRETGRILLMCASGSVGYPSGGCNVGRYYSDDGITFTGGEMTEGLPDGLEQFKFFSSGRICQSSIIKNGSHYRIYSGLATREGSLVLYSDDFGGSWHRLGNAIGGGDECKVEELPDGSLLLSCRISRMIGRMFSVFTYSDDTYTDGKWSEPIVSSGIMAASCNGEVLLAPTDSPDKYILLQSAPCSNRRENVSIYWKRISRNSPFTSPDFYHEWDGCYGVSSTSSAYSTMVLDANGNIAFIWEENNLERDGTEGYDIYFKTLTLKEITGNE